MIFSPAPAEASHLVWLIQEIDGAKKTVDIAIYSYRDAANGDALAGAVARGVNVPFVSDQGSTDSRLPAASLATSTSGKLEANGVDVRFIDEIMNHVPQRRHVPSRLHALSGRAQDC